MSSSTDDVMCPICHECVEGNDYELECGHVFHAACIVPWFRNGNASCPVCRDVRQKLIGLDLNSRARLLMRKSRAKHAPPDLTRAVARVRKAVARAKEARDALAAFKREHRELLKRHSVLTRHTWKSGRKVFEMRRLLGMLDLPGERLPPIVVRKWGDWP